MFSLFLAHGIPLGRTLLVNINVEELGRNHEYNVVAGDSDQNLSIIVSNNNTNSTDCWCEPCCHGSSMVHRLRGRC
jgi:hypothetical protein